MQNLDIIISFLPPAILILLLVVGYFRGRGRNERIMNRTVEKLREDMSDVIEDLTLVSGNPTGRTYTIKLAKPRRTEDAEENNDSIASLLKSVQRARIYLSMEERQMLFSWMLLLFRKAKDFLVIEADPLPQRNEYLKAEVIEWKSVAKHQLDKFKSEFVNYQEVESQSEFGSKFFHKSNYPNALRHLYQNDPLIRKLIYNLPGLHRLSVKSKEDYTLRVVCLLGKDSDLKMLKSLVLRYLRALSETNQVIIKQPKRFLMS